MSNPATTLEYKQIQVCPYCGQPTEERHEQTVCLECQMSLEGENPQYQYECPVCKQLHDEDVICPCEENAKQYEPEDDDSIFDDRNED